MVDADWKPSMGFVYGELIKAKEEIKRVLGGNKKAYEDLEMQMQVLNVELPKYKKKMDRFGKELAISICKVNHDDYDPVTCLKNGLLNVMEMETKKLRFNPIHKHTGKWSVKLWKLMNIYNPEKF
ncbi:hypothetical protein CTI12_AA253220 [Artemisia annua]|uniref:Uncharacterized protein n=1 Tax=Artemisia annua TaxID=35608 RepID=A0A2U1NKZ4_ARTAN|nr:hypothetical protein CTI12_AA253220 [Artemisia annua]